MYYFGKNEQHYQNELYFLFYQQNKCDQIFNSDILDKDRQTDNIDLIYKVESHDQINQLQIVEKYNHKYYFESIIQVIGIYDQNISKEMVDHIWQWIRFDQAYYYSRNLTLKSILIKLRDSESPK